MTHRLLVLLSLWLPVSALALTSDQQLPMTVQADKADIDHQSGIGIYTGNVVVDQGSSHLQASTAKTITDKSNALTQAIAEGVPGHPAKFRTLTSEDKPELTATAEKIEIYPQQHKIVLLGNAMVTQGTDTFSAPRIEYDTQAQHVVTAPSKTGRTTIVIHPNKGQKTS